MVDAFAIQEDFEVVGSDGDPIGLVDHLDDDGIKLKRKDGESGGKHHWIPVDWVDKVVVQDMRVTLNLTGDDAQSRWREERGGREATGGASPHP
jgi:hypothetical protein